MSNLRLSTVSLTLAIAVFALGYANASFAAPKNCVENDPRPSCPEDDPEPDSDPSGGGKSLLFESDDTGCAGATNTGGPSFGHVTWSGNVL